jgi:hypothetical protein
MIFEFNNASWYPWDRQTAAGIIFLAIWKLTANCHYRILAAHHFTVTTPSENKKLLPKI